LISTTERSERGLTLTEVAIVGVLATIVMLGLVGFYMNSQGTWMDASAQAVTQREATTLIESISSKVHAASSARTDPITHQLELFDVNDNTNPAYVFWWKAVGDSADSLIHEGPSLADDRGPPVRSTCEQFQCTSNTSTVDVDLILRSAQGDPIRITTRMVMQNRPPL
jgi:hypothetical protein